MASIRERKTKNGQSTFQIRVSRGRDIKPFEMTWKAPDGWSRNKVLKEVEKVAAQFEVECKQGFVATEKKTFYEYATYVIDMKESGQNIKPRTAERYRELLERINNPDCKGFGYMKLSDVRADNLNSFYKALAQPGMNKADKKKETGLSPKTIREHHRLASMVFAQAVKENLCPYNVAERATPPKVPKHESEHYELELIKEILVALEKEDLKWRCLMNVMISSGARLGEVMGLKWNCVDFNNSRILIRNNLLYSSKRGLYETTTKTEQERYVSLPDSVMAMLKEWKAEQQGISGGVSFKGYLFTGVDGISPMYPDAVGDFLNRFSKRHGFPHLHAHAFRHTQATLLIANGSDIVSVSKRLGHSNVTTTMDIYAHEIAKADKQSANAIDNLLYKEG